MEITNLLHFTSRKELRRWFEKSHDQERECWVVTSRSKTPPDNVIPYIEVVVLIYLFEVEK